jgi:hypothetical protein
MPLKIILLVLALTQAAAPLFLFFDGFDRGAGRPPTPIVPANYAFTIWGVIYGLGVLFSGAQFSSTRVSPMLQRIFLPASCLFLLSTVWLLFARFGPLWGTVPTILAMLGLAVYALLAVSRDADKSRAFADWLALPLFGLYAGWLTIAVFANFTEIAVDLGFPFWGLSLPAWTVLALAAGTALAACIASASRGNASYAAAIVWALIAIAVANARDSRWTIVTVSLVGAAIVTGSTYAARRRSARLLAAAA